MEKERERERKKGEKERKQLISFLQPKTTKTTQNKNTGQIKIGNNQFYGLNYFQSVTPQLSVGGELFWLRSAQKSGAGFAARHAGAAHVATAQIATTGLLSLAYIHRVSDKVSLAADFLWNWTGREAAASFGEKSFFIIIFFNFFH